MKIEPDAIISTEAIKVTEEAIRAVNEFLAYVRSYPGQRAHIDRILADWPENGAEYEAMTHVMDVFDSFISEENPRENDNDDHAPTLQEQA